MNQLKTSCALIAAWLLLLGFNQATAGGPLKYEIRAGSYLDHNDFFLGAGLKTSLLFLGLNPNIEYVFVDNTRFATFNLDGSIELSFIPLIAAWVGAGVGWVYNNPDHADTETEGAVNILVGTGLKIPLNPYAQLKFIVADKNDSVVVGFGIRF